MKQAVSNPRNLPQLWEGREIGDPFLMRFNGSYYLYCSSHGMGPGIKCWVSPDMMNFTYAGYVCEDERIYGAYAPEVMYNQGKFYMVTSPVGSGHYLLRADSPLGPFSVISENLGLAIDGSQFLDDDGKSYFLRASHEGIRIHDMITPDEIDVHGRVIPESYLGHWTEGPMIVKRDGRYFLTDTGNHVLSRGYRVDYCVSKEGPDRGYRRLRDATLLLETRDEFHALGHSSTCVGPDMDTLYIVYHKNILNQWNHPLYRSMNMDRLHFNGDRMYCNATWWPQEAPKQPDCQSRDGEGLEKKEEGRFLPLSAGKNYTAEICLTLNSEQGKVYFSKQAEKGGCLILHADRSWQCLWNDGKEESLSGILPACVDTAALMTVQISLKEGNLRLSLNGMKLFEKETLLEGGKVGLDGESIPGFVGFSNGAQGSSEGNSPKAIPGAWDGVHCIESCDTMEGERGCRALVLPAGHQVSYPVSIWKDGPYHLAITTRGDAPAFDVCISVGSKQQIFTAVPSGKSDAEGMETRYLGVMELKQGEEKLTIAAQQDAIIDRIYMPEAAQMKPMVIVDHGENVTGQALQIIGHKAEKSMLHKFSGYTCAENWGESYFGGPDRDEQIEAEIFLDPCSPNVMAEIYLRSQRESWHPAQVQGARRAYCVRVLPGKIQLLKQNYGETMLASAKIEEHYPLRMALIIKAEGSRITVQRRENEALLPVIDYIDPHALICGRIGLAAQGDGAGFTGFRLVKE